MNVKSDDEIRAWLVTEARKLGTLAATLDYTMEARDAFNAGASVEATMITDTDGDTVTASEARAVANAQRFYDIVRGQQRSAEYRARS